MSRAPGYFAVMSDLGVHATISQRGVEGAVLHKQCELSIRDRILSSKLFSATDEKPRVRVKRKYDEIVTVEEDPIRNVKLKKTGSKEQKKEKGISWFSLV